MGRRPPRSTRTYTLFPYPTLGRSECVRRFHRGGRISEGQRPYGEGWPRHRGAVQWRLAGGRGGEPAAGPVRRRPAGGGRDGHAALRPLHRRALLDRRLWVARPGGGFPPATRLFALSQNHGREGLSGDPRHHGRYRRTEERRVGEGCVSTGRSRGSPFI